MFSDNKKFFIKNKINGFLILYIGFCFFMSVNFFVTANPYAANHSGKTGGWAGVYSDTWVLHVGILLVLASIVSILLTVRKLLYKSILKVLAVFLWLLISGFYTESLFIYPSSYFFIGLTFIFVSILAVNDFRQLRFFDGEKFFLFIVICYGVGILLSLVNPGVYGHIPFGFSRMDRGEVTLAQIFALPLILTTSLVSFKKTKKIKYFILVVILTIIEFSFITKTTIWMLFFPFIIYFIIFLFEKVLSKNLKSKIFCWLFIFGYFLFFAFVIFFLLINYDPYELEFLLNGRLPLWKWHFELFLDNFLFGTGIFPDSNNYTGHAVSEVGLLAAFSQFGFIFGFFQVMIVFVAFKKGIFILIKNRNDELRVFFSYIVLTMFPLWVFQNSWRILNAYDLIFWYSCFFIFFANDKIHKTNFSVKTLTN